MEAACSSNPVCDDIGHESNQSNLNYNESNPKPYMKDTVEVEIQEGCNFCSESKEVPANGVHKDSQAKIDAVLDEGVVPNSLEICTYMESGSGSGSGSSISFHDGAEKCLSKSASFPSSEMEFSLSSCVEEITVSPTYKRSVSLPAPSNLVSAMKGGRAQNGIALKSGLRVKWAVDVYDPPESSMSQTVQSNNHRRLKSKKKSKQRHKHSKGKTQHK